MDAIDVASQDAALGAGEVDPIVGIVDAVKRSHFPRPCGDLFLERAICCVLVEMFETASLAQPQERTVLEPGDLLIVIGLDPRFGRFTEQSLRRAAANVGGVDVEPCLLAILNLIDDFGAVGHPVDGDNEEIAAAVTLGADFVRCAAVCCDGEQLCDRIRIPGFRIRLQLDFLHRRNVIDDRKTLHRPLVKLQICDLR